MTKPQTSPESSQETAHHDSAPENPYAILRISSAFLLEGIGRARDLAGGDLLRNLIFLAIWLECLSEVPLAATQLDLDRGGVAQRAVTVREVADRLKVPYETVRRHANDLVRDGFCARVKGHGIMVSLSRLRTMARNDHLATEVERARAFISALGKAGINREG